MSNELAVIAPKSIDEARSLAATLVKSGLIPDTLRGKEADILFVILTGAEMGLGPMKSLQAFESIKGKVAMKPVWMIGMVRAHPSVKFIKLATTPTKAVVTSQRHGETEVLSTEFTMQDAQTAKLTSSDMYQKWPARMLGWRCAAIHCREHHSDIIGGHYTDEEVATFEERDVTPTPVASTSTPTPASLDAVKAALVSKPKKREYVDAEPAPRASPPVSDDPTRVGYGKHAAKLLSELTDMQLAWYVVESQKPGAAPALAALVERYASEEQRRAAVPPVADAPFVPEVAP